ncbi:hypothetical protein F0562_010280 [Nyssa sinensis]|uniref:Uncharacterized protein n=1 Tax=Nyssa sinensis TaxID=561372 RepID=A0A5J5A3F8_9ASTE|nr:hypothetical protein F0562_010280 [Nyssa sinensis]
MAPASTFSRNVKNYQNPRSRSVCTHCGLPGHTVDKFYKLHGYPSGYRQSARTRTPSVNQVSASSNGFDEASNGPNSTPQFPFTQEQCNQLLSFLQNSSQQPSAMNAIANSLSLSGYDLPTKSLVLPVPQTDDATFDYPQTQDTFTSIPETTESVSVSIPVSSPVSFPENSPPNPEIVPS